MKKLSLGYCLEKTQENHHHTTTIYQGKYCPRSNISIGIIIAPVCCEQENDAYMKVYVWKFWLPMAGVEVFKTVPNPILNIVWILQWSKCGDKAAEGVPLTILYCFSEWDSHKWCKWPSKETNQKPKCWTISICYIIFYMQQLSIFVQTEMENSSNYFKILQGTGKKVS